MYLINRVHLPVTFLFLLDIYAIVGGRGHSWQDQWRNHWEYTVSKMDANNIVFFQYTHKCRINNVDDEEVNDAFSPWIKGSLKCYGLKRHVFTVAICRQHCRDPFNECTENKLVDNVPVFRMELVQDRKQQWHRVQLPVACKCQVRNTVSASFVSACSHTLN